MSNLTFAEDFTTNVVLDKELKGVPDSGLFWNRGTHPLITINNILEIAPLISIAPLEWDILKTYDLFTTSFDVGNIVTYKDNIYQSLTSSNLGNKPDTSAGDWLLTNLNSLRIKSLINSSEDNLIAETKLTRRLIENQFIYNVGETTRELTGDYSGWAFEPKGSDYVKIRINEISFQANTDVNQSLYVVNQGRLINTLTLHPKNGLLEFEDLSYTINGKGTFYFLVDSQSVKSESAYNDSLKYKGFVCYPVEGIGGTPHGSNIKVTNLGNGLNFNVSSFLDSTNYIKNNIVDLSRALQLQFTNDVIKMFLHNPNARSNRSERIINSNLVEVEAIDSNLETVAKKYRNEIRSVKQAINNTFDRFLKSKPSFKSKRTTY